MSADKPPGPRPRRKLRAILAADISNFSGQVSADETQALGQLSSVLKAGRDELGRHGGELISMPGDGMFALFESAVDAVECALAIQARIAAMKTGTMKMRIGLHLGEVLFDDDMAFGEALNITARLESLAEPGGILLSGVVFETVSARVSATFEPRGMPRLKNIPRQIATYRVTATAVVEDALDATPTDPLDDTVLAPKRTKADRQPTLPPTVEQTPATAPPATDPPSSVAPPASSPPRTEPAPWPPSEEITAALIARVTAHVGPVGRILVLRSLRETTSPATLVDRLILSIPPSPEREAFRGEIRRLLG